MAIKDMVRQMKLKRTWSRVLELTRRGYYKDPEKAILFGAPVPPEDVLPLRIAIAHSMGLVFFILFISASLSLHLFSRCVNGLLIAFGIQILFLPNILNSVLKNDDGEAIHGPDEKIH